MKPEMQEAAQRQECGILVVGGGINGAGIARDAAGRGLDVVLCDAGDFGGGTSSASTKLIHGGLRYLEQGDFRLVAHSLAEREVLLAMAPHIAWPLRFVMPHAPGLRPRWQLRAGLWLYDHLGGKSSLPRSGALRLAGSAWGAGLKAVHRDGYVYSDAWVDDARLVIFNLMDAQRRGALLLPRTRLVQAQRQDGAWQCRLEDAQGCQFLLLARVLVNAAGPWVNETAALIGRPDPSRPALTLVRGSHLVLPRLYPGEHAFLLQNSDRRVVFMLPYEGQHTLVGTTEVVQSGMQAPLAVSAEEESYLLSALYRYLEQPARASQVRWRYAGVRPLLDDNVAHPGALSRDYRLQLEEEQGLPLLTVLGGKITTYRRLAEDALRMLAPWQAQAGPAWTAGSFLPGGEFEREHRHAHLRVLQSSYSALPADWLASAFARHGLLLREWLDGCQREEDLGQSFGGGLFEREVRWMVTREWARTPEDILWRRTKCGLHMREDERQAFGEWFRERFPMEASVALPSTRSR